MDICRFRGVHSTCKHGKLHVSFASTNRLSSCDLAGYVLQQGTGEAANEFVPPNRLTKTVLATGHSYFGSMESRLANLADDGPEHFNEAILSLGGCVAGEVGSGGRSWIADLLPKMPMQIIFYEADEDFPPEIQLLFDINAINFLEFEHIAFLTSVFVDKLEEIYNAL